MLSVKVAKVLGVVALVVVMSAGVARAQQPQFPLKAYKNTKLGNSREVAGEVTIGSEGSMVAKVRVSTNEALRGFTGSLCVTLLDGQGNLLWWGMSPGYGVDGEAIPGGVPSRRVEFWQERLPLDAVRRARFVSVHGTHNPKGFVTTLEHTLRQGAKAIDVMRQYDAEIVRLW